VTATRVSRNDPCPCGSGLKYKKCHEGKDAETPTRSGLLTMTLLGLLIVGGATAVVITFARGGAGGAGQTGGRPGQVWSPEHGHWHDATSPARAPINAGAIGEQKAAPAGTPPPGKVWSPEHAHWHDAPVPASPPVDAAATGALKPVPPGPTPPGKIWSPEHGHWHEALGTHTATSVVNMVTAVPSAPTPQPSP
jgi:hypothetical protein